MLAFWLQVRIPAVPDAATLASLVSYLYLDDVAEADATPALHTAAVRCAITRLVALCEEHFAKRLEMQLAMFPGEHTVGHVTGMHLHRGATIESYPPVDAWLLSLCAMSHQHSPLLVICHSQAE
jgi:hypothetical protein